MKALLKNLSAKLTAKSDQISPAQLLSLFEETRQSSTNAALASYHSFDARIVDENLGTLNELESLVA